MKEIFKVVTKSRYPKPEILLPSCDDALRGISGTRFLVLRLLLTRTLYFFGIFAKHCNFFKDNIFVYKFFEIANSKIVETAGNIFF